MIRMVDLLNKNLIDLGNTHRELRKRIENFRKTGSADAEIKKRFFDAFNQEYTTTKLTQEQQKESAVKSVYSLDIDEVNSLNQTLKEYYELARESKIMTDQQKEKKEQYATEKIQTSMKD